MGKLLRGSTSLPGRRLIPTSFRPRVCRRDGQVSTVPPSGGRSGWVRSNRRTERGWPRRGPVVGFADIGPSRDEDADHQRTGEVNMIYVLPERWRRHIGQELMAEARRLIRADGFGDATLWVLRDNEKAAASMRRTGGDSTGPSRAASSWKAW
jgi:ribosomal protein S18 acetylase RimI-like enzyme